MAKVSAKYEVMAVFSLKNGEEPMKELVQKFKERIERHAEAVEVNEDWGKRKLAYPINDETAHSPITPLSFQDVSTSLTAFFVRS